MKFSESDIRIFLYNDVVPYNSNATVLGLILFLVLGLGVSFSNPLQTIAYIIMSVFFLVYLASMFFYEKKRSILSQRFFQCAFGIFFSLIFLFGSFIFSMGQYQDGSALILLLIGILYLLNFMISCVKVLLNLSKGADSENKKPKDSYQTNLLLSVIGYLLLLPIVKLLINATDLDLVLHMAAIFAIAASLYLLNFGCKNLMRALLQIKYKIPDMTLEEYFENNGKE
mgnify:CR=1 FL=1